MQIPNRKLLTLARGKTKHLVDCFFLAPQADFLYSR